MGWNSKAKFGIHSGRTLRSHPTRKYCSFGFYSGTKKRCREFAVVKELFGLPDNRSNDNLDKLFEFDDGIPNSSREPSRGINTRRGYPSYPVIHSLNKHKRWLLPDLVKDCVERSYDELQEEERSSETVKNAPKREHKQSEKLRVTVVERHASPFVTNSTPDCFGVVSNRPSSSSAVRNASKAHAHVGDLKPKTGAEQTELYYEFLSPFPKKNWPSNRQVHCYTKYSYGEVVGSKSRNKCKGRRNKHYRHGLALDVAEMFHPLSLEASVEDVYPKHSSDQLSVPNCLFPIGTYINAVIKNSTNKKETDSCSYNSHKTTPSPVIQYGKGDAIFVDSTDDEYSKFLSQSHESHSNSSKISPNELQNLPSDEKADIQLLSEDIHPDHLMHEFGDNYYEGSVCPRKFIIKADLNNVSPNLFPNPIDCCMLFEVTERPSSAVVVDAQVSLSLPKTELLTKTVSQSVEAKLNRLKMNAGPLSIKSVVSVIAQKIVDECRITSQLRKNAFICFKKNMPKVGKIPIAFIQEVCQQKPEVCGIKRAFQCSTMGVAVKKLYTEQNISKRYEKFEVIDLYCGICLSNVEEMTSGVTSLTRFIQCLHAFCNECWKQYIISCIQGGQGCITCPSLNCKTLASEPLVWSVTNSELYQRYFKLHSQLAIDTNPALRSCPAPNCAHLAYVPRSTMKPRSSLPIQCHCGEVWCFQCQKAAHWPASCEEAQVFRKRLGDYEELKNTLFDEGRITSVLVKRCPFCHYPIYKNTGCQHMLCRCGNDFCWECLSPWDGHEWPCSERVKVLEVVELTDVTGNARYNKYCKVSLSNLQERIDTKRLNTFRKMAKRTTSVENSHKLVSDSESAPCSRLVRSYVKYRISSHVEAIFRFKYLAHFVLENTAAAMAVAKYKKMVGRLDQNIHTLGFIVDRFNEILLEPIVLTDEGKLEQVQELLESGERLIKQIYALTRANRKIN